MMAMLLAAGKGSRLRPLTDEVPKPMLPIAGRPVLEHNVRLLARHGVRDIVINLHHKPEVVRRHFGDGSRFGVSITYSHEPSLLGTAGGVKKVADRFRGTFLVVYGDNLIVADLGALAAFHAAKGAVATVGLWERPDPWGSGVAELGPDDRILRFVEKPRPGATASRWVSAGLLALEPRVLATFPDGPSDLGRDVLPRLVGTGEPVFGWKGTIGLWWIDTLDDYQRADSLARAGRIRVP